LSGEIFRYTAAESLIEKALTESIGYSLDGLMLSTAAGTSIAPPGLLHGATPLTPTVTSGNFLDAMYQDLAALAEAVSLVAANDEQGICFIAAAKQAAFMRLRLTDVSYPVFASSALASGTVIAVASRALAFVARDPRFETNMQALLHLESATLGTPGTPPTVAAPTQSMLQQDLVGIRFIWPLNYAMRDPRGIAYISNVGW
jgi:hypothetical protein